MIATIPPLWRDVDAYIQLTQPPLISTFWGHGPAYGYLAKIPLFLGEQWELWRGIAVVTRANGLTALTDSGVGLLIVGQHLALCGAAYYLIVAITLSFRVRIVLSLLWASCALPYTFAHCVGSESLTIIVTIVVVALGLRLVTSTAEPRWTDWYSFAGALCLCFLSRQVNALFVLLLPATFVLLWLSHFLPSHLTAPHLQRARRTTALRQTVIAVAVGISSLVIATSLPHQLARKTKLHPHSRVGYTFLFRLQFLHELSPVARHEVLQKAARRGQSDEARQLLILLGQMHAEQASALPDSFTQRAASALFPGSTDTPWEKVDLALNQMAFAFLLPPMPELLHAAGKDFDAALGTPAPEIVDNLFETTAYFFLHPENMPGCAQLVTFRGSNAEAINGIPSRHVYFSLWQGMTIRHALALCLITLGLLLAVAHRKNQVVAPVSSFAIALAGIGLLITAMNCLLTEFLPRFVAPLWLLLLLSFLILIGNTTEIVIDGGRQRSLNGPEIR